MREEHQGHFGNWEESLILSEGQGRFAEGKSLLGPRKAKTFQTEEMASTWPQQYERVWYAPGTARYWRAGTPVRQGGSNH